jgi:CheY-like chemotaxis protein
MIDIKNMTILVVDDMKSMRLTIRKMLQNLKIGSTLKFAENGKEAFDILKETKIDLAILDWNMPVMNGFEVLEKIRSDKILRDLPVIMVTAEAERDIVSEAAETEIDGYLLKPLTLAALDQKINSVVARANEPDDVTLHRLKARELEEQGDIEGAIEQIRLALRHKPNASRLIRIMGLLHFKINKEKIGEKCLLKAASVNRQDTITRKLLADYYLKKNKLEIVGRYYLEILSLSVRYHEEAIQLAERLLVERSRELAIELFTKIIVRSKKQNAARERVIDLCLENAEYEYPQRLLEESINENPSNYDMIYKAGLVALESGDEEKALKNFIQVDSHVHSHVDAKFNIAKLYYYMGKVIQADEYINQILRVNPKHEAALALRRQF